MNQGLCAVSRNQECPLIGSQQGIGDSIPTTTRRQILTIIRMSEETDSLLNLAEGNTVLLTPWTADHQKSIMKFMFLSL